MRRKKRRRFTGPIHGRIAALREALDMSQEELAAKISVVIDGVEHRVHVTTISHWEQGVARPPITRLAKLAKALGVTVDDLVRGERAEAA